MANSALTLLTFDTGCGDKAHPGFCATSLALLDLTEIQSVASLAAQAGCFFVILIAFVAGLYALQPTKPIVHTGATGLSQQVPTPVHADATDLSEQVPAPVTAVSMTGMRRSSLRESSSSISMSGMRMSGRRFRDMADVRERSEQWDFAGTNSGTTQQPSRPLPECTPPP